MVSAPLNQSGGWAELIVRAVMSGAALSILTLVLTGRFVCESLLAILGTGAILGHSVGGARARARRGAQRRAINDYDISLTRPAR